MLLLGPWQAIFESWSARGWVPHQEEIPDQHSTNNYFQVCSLGNPQSCFGLPQCNHRDELNTSKTSCWILFLVRYVMQFRHICDHPTVCLMIMASKNLMKLEQVYCALIIKWVVKREVIQLAKLCLTRWWIIMSYQLVLDGSVYGDNGWYLMVFCHFKLVLLDTWLYRVSKGLLCLNIL